MGLSARWRGGLGLQFREGFRPQLLALSAVEPSLGVSFLGGGACILAASSLPGGQGVDGALGELAPPEESERLGAQGLHSQKAWITSDR